ncbi:MAG: AAA family ATPase [Clostridia bacterium]|nr:AAA family ATPase [Clostridia bacterium]
MRIIKLRFQNLNSLYGEWVIDFTNPEYMDQGLFAITGPTGAGKSTILDAICLALYGATPRLGRITKSSNEIMSRHTAECFSEVIFQSQAGTYTCHWSQHRAYRRPDGALAEAVHEISEYDTGRVLETKKRDVLQIIIEKIGMDFEQFTRSILLAQGGFAAFLQASPDERSPILEQMTGTGIYTDISRAVHERQRKELEKLNQIKTEFLSIRFLDEETYKVRREELHQLQKQEKELKRLRDDVQKAVTWHETIRDLKQNQMELERHQKEREAQLETFLPKRIKLKNAQRALEIEGLYVSWDQLRQQQKNEKTDLDSLTASLPDLLEKLKKQQGILEAEEQALLQKQQALSDEQPLLRQVRELDLRIISAQDQSDKLKKEWTQNLKKVEQENARQKQKLEEQKNREDRLVQISTYLEQNARDEQLNGQLPVLRSQAARWIELDQTKKEKKKQLEGLRIKQKEACRQKEEQSQAVIKLKEQQKHTEDEIEAQKVFQKELLSERTLGEYRKECNDLKEKLMLLRKIADLEDERKRLRDGCPCPLCGATEHPYAAGQVPVPDETEKAIQKLEELISQAEKLETVIRELEKKEQEVQKHLANADQALQRSFYACQTIEMDIKRTEAELKDLFLQTEKIRDDLTLSLSCFGLSVPTEAILCPPILDQLEERLRKWTQCQKQLQDLKPKVIQGLAELEKQDAIIKTWQEQLCRAEEEYGQAQQLLEQLKEKRRQLYGDRKPDEEEKKLDQSIKQATVAVNRARVELDEIKSLAGQMQARIDALQESWTRRQPVLDQARNDFYEGLKKLGFADEKEFLDSRMTEAVRQALENEAKQMDQQAADLKTRLDEVKKRLSKEQEKALTTDSYEVVCEQRKTLEEKWQNTGEKAGAIKQQLADHDMACELARSKQKEVEEQSQICLRWNKLHQLIGSADGKKYRNFAQGLTFEHLIAQANKQLQSLSDRYLLIRDETLPLQLNVIDHYQAGEIRSTKNLSGGECFLISLALALGLSRMASQNVRVDSLFLDEGFGSLDEEALEAALETLASLQQEGKLIGIISHVSALKERIRTQLTVTPVSSGRSCITGPGVSRIGF